MIPPSQRIVEQVQKPCKPLNLKANFYLGHRKFTWNDSLALTQSGRQAGFSYQFSLIYYSKNIFTNNINYLGEAT